MKVATKIAWSSGIAVALLMAVVAWDLSVVDRLATVNQDLAQINFRASRITLRQARILDQLDEFTRKHAVTGDAAYADRLGELRTAFARELAMLRSLGHSSRVRAEVAVLSQEWEAYWRLMAEYQDAAARGASDNEGRVGVLLERVGRLRERLDLVSQVAQLAVTEHAVRSIEVSGRARRISWGVAASALLLSILILWLTIRSINRPLTQLTRGTRAVAEGEFSVQLDSQGQDELARLAESFNQMVRRLGEAERAKKDFLSHVSHELKTPLASMQETNELLLEEIAGPLNAKQVRFLSLNLDSSKRLSSMISKLLDLSRLEAGAMDYDFQRQDLVALAAQVVAGFEARARDLGIRILLQSPAGAIVVECDRDRMIQVLENLLDNALKFSPRQSVVEVRVFPPESSLAGVRPLQHSRSGRERIGSHMACVEVADAGPGIPDEEKSLVFKRFHRVVGSQRESVRGVGLGLAICREIMDAHQGVVTVRDNEERGSVFTVALPAAAAVETAAAESVSGYREQSVGA